MTLTHFTFADPDQEEYSLEVKADESGDLREAEIIVYSIQERTSLKR
jgi:hypothetical protein